VRRDSIFKILTTWSIVDANQNGAIMGISNEVIPANGAPVSVTPDDDPKEMKPLG
jgi:hypothetical protein